MPLPLVCRTFAQRRKLPVILAIEAKMLLLGPQVMTSVALEVAPAPMKCATKVRTSSPPPTSPYSTLLKTMRWGDRRSRTSPASPSTCFCCWFCNGDNPQGRSTNWDWDRNTGGVGRSLKGGRRSSWGGYFAKSKYEHRISRSWGWTCFWFRISTKRKHDYS